MKPKHLKFPYQWEERRPLLRDRVLYVPDYYDKHREFTLPEWSDPELFGNSRPISIEFCSGNGEWIFNKAKENPEQNWIAVEMQFKRVRKIFSKRENAGLKNLVIIAGEALTFSKHYLQDDATQFAYVNFPDPWPKDRHAKHRLIQKPFVLELMRILAKGGSIEYVTDDMPYAEQMKKEMGAVPYWAEIKGVNFENYGTSFFERLWRDIGRSFNHLKYINQKK